MVIQPMVRNGICMNAHPVGCRAQVKQQISYAQTNGPVKGPSRALIIGASTGYGLASRIISTFSSGASTIGVYFERPGDEKRAGTAGWYNSIAFKETAERAGFPAVNINGDAFSDSIKQKVIDEIRGMGGKVDLVVYSIAAPVRTDPDTGRIYRSVIKPIGAPFTATTAEPMSGAISEITVPPATDEEIQATIKVMGGEDWRRWIRVLAEAGVLDYGAKTVAYSYVGPAVTHPMYRNGTIGRAKEHLENTVGVLRAELSGVNGEAYVSVNKALVTRASAVIPVVPLYISLLFQVMKKKGIHENCIHQIRRLFGDRLYSDGPVAVDSEGLIRMDDLEMRPDVQEEVADLWAKIDREKQNACLGFDDYRTTFLQFHGFEVEGVDYDLDVEP